MAFCAGDRNMHPRQWERGPAMVEGDILPSTCEVTLRTVCTQLTSMDIVQSVTGKAIGGCAFEYIIRMAGFTGNTDVHSRERETCPLMIKEDTLPLGCVVA